MTAISLRMWYSSQFRHLIKVAIKGKYFGYTKPASYGQDRTIHIAPIFVDVATKYFPGYAAVFGSQIYYLKMDTVHLTGWSYFPSMHFLSSITHCLCSQIQIRVFTDRDVINKGLFAMIRPN
jgi:hypothetical protein